MQRGRWLERHREVVDPPPLPFGNLGDTRGMEVARRQPAAFAEVGPDHLGQRHGIEGGAPGVSLSTSDRT